MSLDPVTLFDERFDRWREKTSPDIGQALQGLSTKLSDEPEALITDLMVAEAWNARLQSILAESNVFLDQGAKVYMPGKDAGYTQLEMRTRMDADLALVRGCRNRVEGLCDAIKQRLILGESILRYQSQFTERKSKDLEKIY